MSKSSTKPKGATSYKDTAFGVLSRSKTLPLELEGTKKGLEYISKIIQEKQPVPVTPEGILQLHSISYEWIFPDWNDYNGRLARILTILILLNLNLPPIELKADTKADRQLYLNAMYKADEGNINLLESLISEALTESLEK